MANESDLIAERRKKLATLRERGNPFPNDFRRNALAGELHRTFGEKSNEGLENDPVRIQVAGRMMVKRVMGKNSFIKLQDRSGQMQIFVQRDVLGQEGYSDFKTWDVGDIVAAAGTLFKTKAGELTIKAEEVRLLTKSLRPLPEKFHGLSDLETRYRQRYVDLIINEETRSRFRLRTRMVTYMRDFLNAMDFLEVETPMMQVLPGGALARPFVTHHNALNMELYLRVAPELFLKRLVVGGLERVYEINRNFRNEGLSTKHNPEFTMLELYLAYADYETVMNITETLIRSLAESLLHTKEINYQGTVCDLGPAFRRVSLEQAILDFNPGLDKTKIRDAAHLRGCCDELRIAHKPDYGCGKLQLEIFEKTVEHKLMEPTFIISYPAEVSPLARCNDNDPFVTDRFELFIAGSELANGFSELNDSEDQKARFEAQVQSRQAGDDEAMPYDADYIRALEYGLPPTAGLGVGIDRLVMLFTDSPSIRDVLLFPHMRPETT